MTHIIYLNYKQISTYHELTTRIYCPLDFKRKYISIGEPVF